MSAPLKIQNETDYDGRTVARIVRFVFRELDLSGRHVVVKVKHHGGGHAYQGRFYPNAHRSAYIYSFELDDYREVGPKVPSGYDHLLVCRIGRAGVYPRQTHVYDRKDSPGTWTVADWQEALVSIAAHEAMHLRQYLTKGRTRGRFNEVETEWAAYRLWKRWTSR